jgi:hypothetical protein
LEVCVIDPAELYEIDADAPVLDEPVLLVALDGFVDAGNAARLACAALLGDADPTVVARFDVDQLVDYRSRRPPLRFETDHWASYSGPELQIVALADTGDTPYLLLTGPEPDTQWERFCAAVLQVVEQLGVRLVINLTAIPMAGAAHPPDRRHRPRHPSELTEGHEAWFAAARSRQRGGAHGVPPRRGRAGRDGVRRARAALPGARGVPAGGAGAARPRRPGRRALPAHRRPVGAAARAEAEIAEQVEASDEVKQVVAALERQYDTVVESRAEGGAMGLGGELPSADELAAEVERYLADRDDPGSRRRAQARVTAPPVTTTARSASGAGAGPAVTVPSRA